MSAAATTIDVGMLYASHGDWLREWLRRHTRCSHRAADLAQDTFCRVLETNEGAPVRDPRNYLSTVARRILIDDIRHREVERAYLAVHAERMGDADHLTPARVAEAAQLLDAILRLLETLPDKARRAFMMIRFDGLRYADAAKALGVSERMVKRYVVQVYAHCYAFAYPD
ncbi:RNA polymerase sigma-70 family protein [Sphingobium indicum BiD32]|uniref:RNA polymerase sigma-70 family protein n=1 Tax=Sphingobium indicum BiD32 TaxID=1301087 RepID=N1MK50_9SPHN|nr:sigma-70 family RNA polymerase sigma factor [Sphingobium indicum]CCW17326.1 RNA polymerase sigma-70 family protein [Sphingobium indicum BiD32]